MTPGAGQSDALSPALRYPVTKAGDLARAILDDPEPIAGAERRLLRHLLRLSQQGLAEAIGSTRVTVCRWERGLQRPRRATDFRLRRLAAARLGLVAGADPAMAEPAQFGSADSIPAELAE